MIAAASALPGSAQKDYDVKNEDPYRLSGVPSHIRTVSGYTEGTGLTSYDGQTPSPTQQRQPSALYQQSPKKGPSTSAQPQTYQPTYQSAQGAQPQPQPQPQQQTQQQQPAPLQPQHVNQPQPQSFLGSEPAVATHSLARQNSSYGDWMAPAAAGAGAGAIGVAAYEKYHNAAASMQQEPAHEPLVGSSLKADALASNSSAMEASRPSVSSDGALSASTAATEVSRGPAVDLGGNEAEGARETGNLPTVVRHNTAMSASALHVPGEYPKRE